MGVPKARETDNVSLALERNLNSQIQQGRRDGDHLSGNILEEEVERVRVLPDRMQLSALDHTICTWTRRHNDRVIYHALIAFW